MYAGKLTPVYIQIPGVPGTRFHPGSIMLIYRLIIFAVVPFFLFSQHGVFDGCLLKQIGHRRAICFFRDVVEQA